MQSMCFFFLPSARVLWELNETVSHIEDVVVHENYRNINARHARFHDGMFKYRLELHN